MITRFKSGIVKPNSKYASIVITQAIPREPRSECSALAHDGWRKAMQEQLDALQPKQDMGSCSSTSFYAHRSLQMGVQSQA